jgi:hypothetical protein
MQLSTGSIGVKDKRKSDQQMMFHHVENWQLSGQTGVAYSKENGIAKSVLYYWLKKYRTVHQDKVNVGKGFVELDVQSLPGASATNLFIEVLLPTGACIKCYKAVEASFIRSILY